ncbi:hypothetical protein H310_10495 [Aphanomyces invadans]|uniref:Tc1-like transposase DDE domain-containing protein n=1 Tax=Aphanomyces invadans TaxID=157072 RepID=A0A024TQM7_9STRA|nr:hypothetical protein H310_10495 [Aphanomyces invadans]ETV96333.1 hypothetical protein H310_10495 [Aphanomyces invadans]|eukprot:XP_008875125.1 hypothetical protein H310_10495 [Aphanomyces invadans]
MQSYAVSTMPPPVVYTDESFNHHHYKCHNDSLYDPNYAFDNATKERHKCQRHCLIAGILDSATMDSKLLGLNIFTGGKARGNEPKDYHGKFLSEMDQLHLTNALIVMDNSIYHKGRPGDTPSSRMRKKRLQDECVRFGIEFDEFDYKSILWEKQSQYIHKHIDPAVGDMAKKRGHTFVFTPPHHSDDICSPMRWFGPLSKVKLAVVMTIKPSSQTSRSGLKRYLLL